MHPPFLCLGFKAHKARRKLRMPSLFLLLAKAGAALSH
jgi:hypothetical protein